MSKQLKIYQSIDYQVLDTYVMAGGSRRLIEFRGGSLQPRINGKFSTSDPEIIAALDADIARGGASFKCIHSEDLPDGAKAKGKKESEENDFVPEDFNHVTGITTGQAARDFLLENVPGLSNTKLPNIATIKEVAKANKIFFVDLK